MRAAIFDFDGTIVRSEHNWIHTFDRFEADYGLDATPHDVRLTQMAQTVLNVAEFYFAKYQTVRDHFASPKALAEDFNGKTESLVYKTEPICGVVRYINLLHEHGTPVVIASSGRREHIKKYFDTWDISVDDIVTVEDVAHCKPAADVYIEAMRRAGVTNPSDCVVFEDNPSPASNAARAGFRVVMIQSQGENGVFSGDTPFAERVISTYESLGADSF